MTMPTQVLYSVEAQATGGRDGTAHTLDGGLQGQSFHPEGVGW